LSGGPAQLILIAPHRYLNDVEPLLQARRAEGLSARVDFNDDGNPELAIGRLPVRTSVELSALIARILAPGNAAPNSALFIAERANPAEGADYAAELNQVIAGMPAQWQNQAQRVYLDQYPAGSTAVAQARAAIVDSITAGRSLVSYFGHGSPTVWSREQLLQSAQLGSLFGPGYAPAPVVSEFGCWGGYFVAPQYNTMSHGWLLAGGSAASGVFASSGLTDHHSDRRMAEVLLPALAQSGVRLGDALRMAKQTLHASEPELQDVLRGMSLFGDPSMRIGN